MKSYLGRAANENDEKRSLAILREGLNFYSEILRTVWNETPQGDKPMILFGMETLAAMIRKTWPEDAKMADLLGEVFNGAIVAASVPKKDGRQ